MLKEWRMDTILLGQCPKVGSCEYCKEVPVFIKGWTFSQQQRDYHLLQKVILSVIHNNIEINKQLK